MGVHVRWDCDLDSRGADCQPQYSFQLQERSYNFRYGPTAPPPGRPPEPRRPAAGGGGAGAPSTGAVQPPLCTPSPVLPPAFPPPHRGLLILLFPVGFIFKSSKAYRRVQRLVP